MKKQINIILSILSLSFFVGHSWGQVDRKTVPCNMIKDMAAALPDVQFYGKYKLSRFICFPPSHGLLECIFSATDTTNKKTSLTVTLSDSKMDTRIDAKIDLSVAKASREKDMQKMKESYERYKIQKPETPPILIGISSIGFGQYGMVSTTGTANKQPDGTIVCMASFACIIKDRYVLTITALYDADVSVDFQTFDNFVKDYVLKIRETELKQ